MPGLEKRALAFARFHRLQLPKKATLSERHAINILEKFSRFKPECEKMQIPRLGEGDKEAGGYSGSVPDRGVPESFAVSASKQRTGPLEPHSAENTADTAGTTRLCRQ